MQIKKTFKKAPKILKQHRPLAVNSYFDCFILMVSTQSSVETRKGEASRDTQISSKVHIFKFATQALILNNKASVLIFSRFCKPVPEKCFLSQFYWDKKDINGNELKDLAAGSMNIK